MKAVATGFLIGAAIVWIVFLAWERHGGPAFTGYVRAAAEAGMVGAFADWFAVTALFRHPLGLKIPHTAIIPRKKDQLGASLSDFVGENFLSVPVVSDKLRSARIASRAGAWLSRRENAERVTAEAATVVRGAVAVLRDDEVQAVIDQAVTRRVVAQQWGPPMGKLLEGILDDGSHRRVVDLICDRVYDWVRLNHDTVMTLVSKQAPSWSPRFVDGLIGDRLYAEALSFAWAVKSDPDHPLRKAIDRFLTSFAGDLQHEPETIARVEDDQDAAARAPRRPGPHQPGLGDRQGDDPRRGRGPVERAAPPASTRRGEPLRRADGARRRRCARRSTPGSSTRPPTS